MGPQLEDGYLKIANELFDALIRHRIPGEQRQCFDFIIRKTYGFNKKWDQISNSQFVEATGLKKQNVSRAIRKLIDRNIVIKKDYSKSVSYCINKHSSTWKLSSKVITNKSNQKGLQVVIKSDYSENVIQSDDAVSLNESNNEQTAGSKLSSKVITPPNKLSSKVMDTKDSNNVTKDRGTPEGGQEKKKDKNILAKLKKLSAIAAGNFDQTLVGDYAFIGETFPDMQVRAKKELEEIKREMK